MGLKIAEIFLAPQLLGQKLPSSRPYKNYFVHQVFIKKSRAVEDFMQIILSPAWVRV